MRGGRNLRGFASTSRDRVVDPADTANSNRSNRTDLHPRDQTHVRCLYGSHLPAQERLGHCIHLIIVSSVRKLHALFNEIVYPRRELGVRQVHIAGFDQREQSLAPAPTLPPCRDLLGAVQESHRPAFESRPSRWPCPRSAWRWSRAICQLSPRIACKVAGQSMRART